MTTRRLFLKSSGLAMFGVGAAPMWLARAADGPSPRKKVLVAVFQRGAVDGLNVVVPFGEKNYYALRPTIAIPAPKGGHGICNRPRRLLRPASGARAAQADLRCQQIGDRARRGIARSDAFALRRAGLHGIGHAGTQGHHRRLAESGAAAVRGRSQIASARSEPGAVVVAGRCAGTTKRSPSTI